MAKMGYAQRIRYRAAELRKLIDEAQAELDELEVAERVIERLAADQDDDQDSVARGARRTREPTIGDMAVKFLAEVGPMSTGQLLDHMREHWREDLGDTTLTSTLSRTKNAGRIDYKDGLWLVPVVDRRKENEPPVGGSEVEEVRASSDLLNPATPGDAGDSPMPTHAADPALHSGREGGD